MQRLKKLRWENLELEDSLVLCDDPKKERKIE